MDYPASRIEGLYSHQNKRDIVKFLESRHSCRELMWNDGFRISPFIFWNDLPVQFQLLLSLNPLRYQQVDLKKGFSSLSDALANMPPSLQLI